MTYRFTDGHSAWVLRRPPSGGLTQSAHDVLREFKVTSALQDTPVPVVRTVGCEGSGEVLGAPFAVLEYVDGRTMCSSSDLAGWTDQDCADCAAGLVGALVALHRVDCGAAVGLADFGRSDSYAARQLRRWLRQWQEMAATDPRADRLLALLQKRVSEQATCAVVHGDDRVDNTVLDATDPGTVRAILDWEMSTLGDPVDDVALMCAYQHPALAGVDGMDAAGTDTRFPGRDALRQMYEERAGAPLTDWSFHLALAIYKIAVIAEGIAYRHRLGASAGEGFERVVAMVPEFLEAGLQEVSERV